MLTLNSSAVDHKPSFLFPDPAERSCRQHSHTYTFNYRSRTHTLHHFIPSAAVLFIHGFVFPLIYKNMWADGTDLAVHYFIITFSGDTSRLTPKRSLWPDEKCHIFNASPPSPLVTQTHTHTHMLLIRWNKFTRGWRETHAAVTRPDPYSFRHHLGVCSHFHHVWGVVLLYLYVTEWRTNMNNLHKRWD